MEVKELIKVDKNKKVQSNGGEIRTIDEMWDAAINDFNEGLYDTEAMTDIAGRMNPKLTYQDIAIVCSGVYADTYWNNTYMDCKLLSKSLVQALAISQSLADNYADRALKQWRGLLSRDNINDYGNIPTQGSFTQSTDVVCNQNTAIPTDELIKNWNNQYWKTPQAGGANYVYVRSANVQFDGNITNAKAEMFYADAGFNQPPSSWIQCYTFEGSKPEGSIYLLGEETGPMRIGDRGVSEAFKFDPKSTGHFCLIATTTSDFFTKNKPLSIPPGNWSSQQYITYNGGAVWHNIDPQQSIESKLVFYNQDEVPEDFVFVANCQNVPVGSKVGLRSTDPKCAFDTGLIDIANSSQQIGLIVNVPSQYKGQLVVTMKDKNGELLPKDSLVKVTMFWKLRKGHKYYVKAAKQLNLVESVITGEEIHLNLGSFTLIGGKA